MPPSPQHHLFFQLLLGVNVEYSQKGADVSQSDISKTKVAENRSEQTRFNDGDVGCERVQGSLISVTHKNIFECLSQRGALAIDGVEGDHGCLTYGSMSTQASKEPLSEATTGTQVDGGDGDFSLASGSLKLAKKVPCVVQPGEPSSRHTYICDATCYH